MTKTLSKVALLSFLFINILNRDINIELFKKETIKNKGLQNTKINGILINNLDLEKGYLSEFSEDFYYLSSDINKKPVLNNEKIGVQYGIKKISDEDYIIDINIKTDKTLETLPETIYINKYQGTQKISEFKIKSKKIEAKIIQEKEKIVVEIGQDYFITVEKTSSNKVQDSKDKTQEINK